MLIEIHTDQIAHRPPRFSLCALGVTYPLFAYSCGRPRQIHKTVPTRVMEKGHAEAAEDAEGGKEREIFG
jgi:hypothetical protein